MRFYRSASGIIARERLRGIVESDPFCCSPDQMDQMKKEIMEILGRYMDADPGDFEVRIALRPKQKRA